MIRPERMGVALVLAAGLATFAGCAPEGESSTPSQMQMSDRKGGDDRSGAYDATPDFWKPAPDHSDEWTWGEVSGMAADTPNRIIVAVWGDRSEQGVEGVERPNSSNYLFVVDSMGNITERWTQWDTIVNRPHQLYINPYDPERHVWLVERGGAGIHEQIIEFSNDGKEILTRLVDPNPVQSNEEARANKNPGPLDFAQPSVMTFLPDGHFLLADGYQNGRVMKFTLDGEFVSEFGSVGSGPGQFDLMHGIAVDRDRRIYVADRNNDRIEVFTEDGEFIEEWPDILDPVGIFIDEDNAVWVLAAALNRILKYDTDGHLQYYWGTHGRTSRGFEGGFVRPHQMDVDSEGHVFVASWEGGYLSRFTPTPGADPAKLVGQPLTLED